jgi:hypothetical protein
MPTPERVTPAQYKELLKGHGRKPAKTRHPNPHRVANLEQVARYGMAQADEGPAFNSPVDILVIHHRSRLADPSGISDKAGIDGIVACGILRDDSLKEINEIRERQVKVRSQAEEETEFVIERLMGRIIL